MPVSKSQALLTKLVRQRFPYLTWYSNIRPTATPNRYNERGLYWHQETNLELGNKEIDIYAPQIRLAIEFDGAPHDRPDNYFHGTKVKLSWWQKFLGFPES